MDGKPFEMRFVVSLFVFCGVICILSFHTVFSQAQSNTPNFPGEKVKDGSYPPSSMNPNREPMKPDYSLRSDQSPLVLLADPIGDGMYSYGKTTVYYVDDNYIHVFSTQNQYNRYFPP